MKRTNAEFLNRLENWMPTAPDDEIRRLLEPNNLVELYQTFGYAPGAWTDGTNRMRAELKARQCKRDGLRVKRSGGVVFENNGASQKEKLIRIGRLYWSLEKRTCLGTGVGPEGEPTNTPEGIEKWQRGPKVWHWFDLLQFRGFRVWVYITEKDHPELFEGNAGGKTALPGVVDEIMAPNKAKYSFAGVVTVRLKVEAFPAEGSRPLSPEEIKAAGEVIDFLKGIPITRADEKMEEAITILREQMIRDHAQHAETLDRVEQQGADIAQEARRLKEGKRQAEEKPMDVAREVVETMLKGLTLQQRNLYLAMQDAKGIGSHAAEALGVAQSTVSKALPALRDAIRATGRELPEFLLPPAARKRGPDAPRKMAFGAGGIEAADTRTPFDEVAEKEERGGGAE